MKKTNENNVINGLEVVSLPLGKAMLLGACLAFAGLTANATPTYRVGSYSFNYGNEWAGASGLLSASAGNDRRDCWSKDFSGKSGYSRAYFSAIGDVTFLKQGLHAVEFVTCAVNNYGNKSATYSLQLAGYNVDSGYKTQSYNWIKYTNNTTFWSGEATYVLSGIPITVKGKVGGGASIGYELQLPDSGAGLAGWASTWLSGEAAAGVEAYGFGVELVVDVDSLGKTTIQPSLKATPTTLSGKVDLVFDPIDIGLDLALLAFGKRVASAELVSYHAPSYTWPLIQGFSLTNNICTLSTLVPIRAPAPLP